MLLHLQPHVIPIARNLAFRIVDEQLDDRNEPLVDELLPLNALTFVEMLAIEKFRLSFAEHVDERLDAGVMLPTVVEFLPGAAGASVRHVSIEQRAIFRLNDVFERLFVLPRFRVGRRLILARQRLTRPLVRGVERQFENRLDVHVFVGRSVNDRQVSERIVDEPFEFVAQLRLLVDRQSIVFRRGDENGSTTLQGRVKKREERWHRFVRRQIVDTEKSVDRLLLFALFVGPQRQTGQTFQMEIEGIFLIFVIGHRRVFDKMENTFAFAVQTAMFDRTPVGPSGRRTRRRPLGEECLIIIPIGID